MLTIKKTQQLRNPVKHRVQRIKIIRKAGKEITEYLLESGTEEKEIKNRKEKFWKVTWLIQNPAFK